MKRRQRGLSADSAGVDSASQRKPVAFQKVSYTKDRNDLDNVGFNDTVWIDRNGQNKNRPSMLNSLKIKTIRLKL